MEVFSTVGDIMSTVGDVHEYCWDVQYCAGYNDKFLGYLEYRGGVQYHGGYHEYYGGYMIQLGDIMSTVRVFSAMEGYNLLLFEYFHGTEHPYGTHDIPSTCILISPNAAKITKDDIPHGTEYP